MRAITKFLVLTAALGAGAYVYYPSIYSGLPDLPALTTEPRISFARSTQPAALAVADAEQPVDVGTSSRTRVFSPQSPLFAPAVADMRATKAVPAQAPSALPAADRPGSANGSATGSAVVTTVTETTLARPVTDWATTVTRNTAAKGQKGAKPSDPEARADLVREIQTELKRVGCYDGEIDGSWGAGSKRAMTTFTERINASLPIDEPDYILLTLVQGHRVAACGESCPVGQTMTDGRCMPRAVVASNARRGRKSGEALVTTGSIGESDRSAENGKTSLQSNSSSGDLPPSAAKPRPRTIAEEIGAVTASSEPVAAPGVPSAAVATVTPIEPSKPQPATRKPADEPRIIRRAVEPVAPTVTAKAEPAARPEPLPGRMTVGGPVSEQRAAPAPVTSSNDDDDDDDEAPAQARSRRPAAATHHAPAPRPVVNAPAPRVVNSPARQHARHSPPRYVSAAPSSGSSGSSAAARQRAMVYNLFQRPDRY